MIYTTNFKKKNNQEHRVTPPLKKVEINNTNVGVIVCNNERLYMHFKYM